jgi:hypothetical protein
VSTTNADDLIHYAEIDTNPALRRRLISDTEAQSIIEDEWNKCPFYTNMSDNHSIEELQQHFIESLDQREILCGYADNKNQLSVEYAVYCRKINLRATPHGWNWSERCWNKSYHLPRFMTFDIDQNKASSPFKNLFGDYKAEEIHDALDIARPLVTTINPISGNAQYIYKMSWSFEDMMRFTKDEASFLAEYDAVRRELSNLFGGDPGLINHVLRSPMFIAGWHRKNPNRKTSSKYRIDIGNESLFHRSIWYNPKAYTLQELKALIVYLRDLHISLLGNGDVMNATYTQIDHYGKPRNAKKAKQVPTTHLTREQAFALDLRTIKVGNRKNSLFDKLRWCHVYPVVRNYRTPDDNHDYDGLIAYLLPIARDLNQLFKEPLTDNEVLDEVQSIATWSLDNYNSWKSFNLTRWAGHVPEWKKQGISRSTFYARKHRKLVIRSCACCGADITTKRSQAKFCSDRCTDKFRYQSKKRISEDNTTYTQIDHYGKPRNAKPPEPVKVTTCSRLDAVLADDTWREEFRKMAGTVFRACRSWLHRHQRHKVVDARRGSRAL